MTVVHKNGKNPHRFPSTRILKDVLRGWSEARRIMAFGICPHFVVAILILIINHGIVNHQIMITQ